MAKKLTTSRLNNASAAGDIEAYHRFVDESPQGILYAKTWWLEAVAPAQWEVLLLKSGDAIRAAWPYVYATHRKAITMPNLTQKLGVLFAPSAAKYVRRLGEELSLMQQLLEATPEGYWLNQRFHEAFTNWLPFHWKGFSQTTLYTYILDDLGDPDALYGGMAERCKRALKKAAKSGLQVHQTDDMDQIVRLSDMTYARQRVKPLYQPEQLHRLDAACQQHAGRRALLAKDASGRIHACDYMVYDERCAVSLIQGADPEVRDSGAQRLLDWDSIQFAAKVSKLFDFEGSMLPGIESYNREFGAKQTPYFQITGRCSAGSDPSFLRRCRDRLARFLQRAADAAAR